MCLLVVVFGLDPGAPLVIGANRDERLDRPATAMTVLREGGPRVLGGRDEQAGGTWLAVNEHGVVAGLTNRPSPDGRDPSKRSRGELPLALAGHADAAAAVDDVAARLRPADYNPAWLLVGDRTTLYALDMTGDGQVEVEELGAGIHILENNPLHTRSAKVDHVRALLGDAADRRGDDLLEVVRSVLADHSVPGTVTPAEAGRAVETLAACVHTESYGTRSSTLVAVPAETGRAPRLRVADGHPCTAPFVDAAGLWRP
ncbi:MAG TPA: NRDE family protein [Acidimicrobiales bacterium]|nr:NRDE family protein [Acidimicrobiales bacterium]